MLRNVFSKTLKDQRRSLLWWAVAIAWVVLVYVGGYRSYVEAGLATPNVPDFVATIMGTGDFFQPEGYVTGIVYTLLGSLLVILAATFAGARAVAGDEEDGMLDVLLTHPLSRTRLVLERGAALAVSNAWLGFVTFAAVAIAAALNEMGLSLGNIAAASIGLAMTGLVFGLTALTVGALWGRRGLALGVTAAVALTSYLLNALAPLLGDLDWLGRVSAFHYYLGADPVRNGFDWAGLGVLAAAAAVLLLIAAWGLGRRDVGT